MMPMAFAHRLPYTAQARLDAELSVGERLVWVGQPHRGSADAVPVGIIALGLGAFAAVLFTIGIVAGVHGSGPAIPMGVMLSILALVLLGVSRSLEASVRDTVYAITDRRALVLEPARLGIPATTRSYASAALARLARRDHEDGSGDLVFEERWAGKGGVQGAGFIGVAHVRHVEALLRGTLLA